MQQNSSLRDVQLKIVRQYQCQCYHHHHPVHDVNGQQRMLGSASIIDSKLGKFKPLFSFQPLCLSVQHIGR